MYNTAWRRLDRVGSLTVSRKPFERSVHDSSRNLCRRGFLACAPSGVGVLFLEETVSFVAESVTIEGSFRIAERIERAFQLFSPKGEEAWVPGWRPEFLSPADGTWQEGQVFRTAMHGQESIWFVARLDSNRHAVTYHRVDTGIVAVTVTVVCSSVLETQTEVSVGYRFVGLSERGNEEVRRQASAGLDERLAQWQLWIARVGSAGDRA